MTGILYSLASFTVPIKTVTEGNAKESIWARAKRAKRQRSAATMACPAFRNHRGRFVVSLTRVAPSNGLDGHDNLRASLKHIVDGIADRLEVDDGDTERVEWRYAQRRGKPREYAVEVVIEAA